MPTVRVTTSVARSDGDWTPGEHRMTPEQAQDAVAGGWGELVREERVETPESSRAQRQPGPERRTRNRSERRGTRQ